jgi:hypothetical protein
MAARRTAAYFPDTVGVLALSGFTINTLTMFGIVLAIGRLVDDAIVVVKIGLAFAPWRRVVPCRRIRSQVSRAARKRNTPRGDEDAQHSRRRDYLSPSDLHRKDGVRLHGRCR